MKRHLTTQRIQATVCCAAAALSMLCSCSDDYAYDDKEPDFLGGSIYEYLQGEGEFKTYLRMMPSNAFSKTTSME